MRNILGLLSILWISSHGLAFESHEIGLSVSDASFSFETGVDRHAIGLQFHRKVFRNYIQLGGDFTYSRGSFNGLPVSQTQFFIGPTFNLPIGDRRIKQAPFLFLGFGATDTSLSRSDFSIRIRLGKRFQLTGYLAYTPSVSLTLIDFEESVQVNLLSFSLIF